MWTSVKESKPKVEQVVLVALVADDPQTGFERPQVALGRLDRDGNWNVMLWGIHIPHALVQFWQPKPELPNELLPDETVGRL